MNDVGHSESNPRTFFILQESTAESIFVNSEIEDGYQQIQVKVRLKLRDDTLTLREVFCCFRPKNFACFV